MSASRVLQLNPKDNVLVALTDLRPGELIEFGGQSVALRTDVPAKHKFAMQDFAAGDAILMYGVLIGKATEAIAMGAKLTTRNVRHEAAEFHEKTGKYTWQAPDVSRWADKKFLGHIRSDGQVGTRNYWLVVPLVFCENRNILVMKQAFEEELGFAPPQVYRQQVAELVRNWKAGGTAQNGGGGVEGYATKGAAGIEGIEWI